MANGSWEYAEFDFCDVCAVEDVSATGGLRARGWTDVPGSVRDIVSWASIGVSAIVTTEALCCEVAPALARLGCEVPHCERVVWRVANKRGALSALRGGGPGALLTADGVLGKLVGTPSRDELSYKALGTVDPVRALWDMGFALESVGVECTVNVPAIGGFP